MPVYLRRFYSNTLVDEKKSESDAIENSKKPKNIDPNKIIPFQSK